MRDEIARLKAQNNSGKPSTSERQNELDLGAETRSELIMKKSLLMNGLKNLETKEQRHEYKQELID